MKKLNIDQNAIKDRIDDNILEEILGRLISNKLSLFGSIYILLIIVLALITPLIAPYDYAYQNLDLGPSAPSATHWLGTDTLGRDLLTRMMYGSRVSLMVGFLATAVALTIGVLSIFSICFSANLITLELNEPANPRSLVITIIPVFFTFLFSTNEISETLICGKILQIKS